MKRIGWPGKGYKMACHRCGFWFPSTEIKKEWTGLYVCKKDYESRHPQTLIKVHGEKAFPDIVSKDITPVFVSYCDITTRSGYADMGTADCMQADNAIVSYSNLLDLYTNGHENVLIVSNLELYANYYADNYA